MESCFLQRESIVGEGKKREREEMRKESREGGVEGDGERGKWGKVETVLYKGHCLGHWFPNPGLSV